MQKFIKIILSIIFIIYFILLTQQILFKYPLEIMDLDFYQGVPHWQRVNFIPFDTIYFYLFIADLHPNIIFENIAGNIIGFIPFGFMISILSKKRLNVFIVTLLTFLLSLTYELLQYYFPVFGSFDVDDLILNTFGGLLGFIIWKVLHNIIGQIYKK